MSEIKQCKDKLYKMFLDKHTLEIQLQGKQEEIQELVNYLIDIGGMYDE